MKWDKSGDCVSGETSLKYTVMNVLECEFLKLIGVVGTDLVYFSEKLRFTSWWYT